MSELSEYADKVVEEFEKEFLAVDGRNRFNGKGGVQEVVDFLRTAILNAPRDNK